MQPGGSGFGGNGMSGPAPTARPVVHDVAPPALPGAGNIEGIATAPKLKKANTGDPTTDLFTAINKGNYGDAQDAISRGANLDAQNALGETPLDLSIALNKNPITFMLLSARNEGDSGQPVQAAGANLAGPVTRAKPHAVTAKAIAAKAMVSNAAPAHAKTATTPTGAGGEPNVSVGFLGFSQK